MTRKKKKKRIQKKRRRTMCTFFLFFFIWKKLKYILHKMQNNRRIASSLWIVSLFKILLKHKTHFQMNTKWKLKLFSTKVWCFCFIWIWNDKDSKPFIVVYIHNYFEYLKNCFDYEIFRLFRFFLVLNLFICY